MEPAEPRAYRYDAFISYRHVDPDRRWAKWLHAALEGYRTPRPLVEERGVSPRLARVFRDEEEVPASANLGAEIENALKDSRFLIVICSPRASGSRWIQREIETFRELGRGDQILALLIEGTPQESFPAPLREIRRRIESHDGSRHESIEEVEPLAADVRATRSESRPWLRRRAQLRMLAALLGCRFDDLVRRDEARRRRAVLVRTVVLSLLVLVLALSTAYALLQRSVAETKRREADREAENARASEYVATVNLADSLVAQGLYSQARLVLDGAVPARRRFEFFHLRSRVDPSTREWSFPEPVLAVLDADENGIPERFATATCVRSLEGPLARWPLPASSAGFAGTGRWSWAFYDPPADAKGALFVRDERTEALAAVELGHDVVIGTVGGDGLRDRIVVYLIDGENSRLVEVDLATRTLTAFVTFVHPFGIGHISPAAGERGWIVVPNPEGTLAVPQPPRMLDFEAGTLVEIEAGEGIIGPRFGGCLAAAALWDERIAFHLDTQLGLYLKPEPDQGPWVQVTLDKSPYPIQGLVADPRRDGFAVWDEGGNVRWYRLGEKSSTIDLVLTLGCRGRVSCVAPSPSGAWTFVGSDAGRVVAVPHRPWPGRDGQRDPPQGSFFSFHGSHENYGWKGFLAVADDPPGIELVCAARVFLSEPWTFGFSRWSFADGSWLTDQQVDLPEDDLVFRMSGADRGAEELEEIVPVPAFATLPVWIPSERRCVRVEVEPNATGYAVASNGRFLATQTAGKARLGRVDGDRVRYLHEIPLAADETLAGVDGGGRYAATWSAKRSVISISVWASGARLPELRIADEPVQRRGHGVAFTPEGDRFACWTDGSTIGLFDTLSGKRVLSLRSHADYPGGDVQFSPDGALLWTKWSERLSSLGRSTDPVVWASATPLQMALRTQPAK